MNRKDFNQELNELHARNVFAARVVIPFARRLSRDSSMPDQESLLKLLNEAIQEAVPSDVSARWIVVESIRSVLPEILRLARDWILIEAAEHVRAAELMQTSCPSCRWIYKWDRSAGKCGFCGYQSGDVSR